MDCDGVVRCDSYPVRHEQLLLALIRGSMDLTARVDANVSASVYQIRDARIFVWYEKKAGHQAVVFRRVYGPLLSFPDFQVHGYWDMHNFCTGVGQMRSSDICMWI